MRRPLSTAVVAFCFSAANVYAADSPAAKKTGAKPAAVSTKATEPKTRAPTVVDPRDEPEKKPEPKKPEAKKPDKPLTPGGVYRAGDTERPRPQVVAPGAAYGAPPADAVVLFDGQDLSKWNGEPRRAPAPKPAPIPDIKKPAPPKQQVPAKIPDASQPGEPAKKAETAVKETTKVDAKIATVAKPKIATKPEPVLKTVPLVIPAKAEKPVDPPAQWKLAADSTGAYMEVPQPRIGGIVTKDEFGSCQIHVEWATPSEVKGAGQGRGNSGIMLQGIGEVQVLDSYQNDTYPDGQAAAIYSKYPPLVNASRKPGEWQTYDIVVELAQIDEKTKAVKRPARITVMHNGVIVQHASEVESRATKFKLALQDHGNPVRYRNIWIRPLKQVATSKP